MATGLRHSSTLERVLSSDTQIEIVESNKPNSSSDSVIDALLQACNCSCVVSTTDYPINVFASSLSAMADSYCKWTEYFCLDALLPD